MSFPIYHLDIMLSGCRGSVVLNGFPLLEPRRYPEPQAFTRPLNPYLVGDNELRVEIDALTEDPRLTSRPGIVVEGSVRRLAKGDIAGAGAGAVVVALDVDNEVRTRALPWSLSWRFPTGDAPSFGEQLCDAEATRDRQALRDYAIELRDMVARGDGDGLLAQMQPKIHAFARAYDEPAEAVRDDVRETLVQGLIAAEPEIDFSPDEVEAVPWCRERIWELRRRGGLRLLRAAPDADGGRLQLRVCVGVHQGALRIVR